MNAPRFVSARKPGLTRAPSHRAFIWDWVAQSAKFVSSQARQAQ
jgi:hypothetical protein